jgi:hypothetical protein
MSEDATKLRIQLETIRSMFDEMGGIQKVLADLTIVHDWVKRLEQLRQQMHSFERCSQTAEQKYLDVQRIMENRNEIRCELNQALHSSKEIRKDCQQLKDEVDAKYQKMIHKIEDLVKAEMQEQITQITSNFSVFQQAVEEKISKAYNPDYVKELYKRVDGLHALLSGDIVNVRTEISKVVFPVRNLAEENHACLKKQINNLQKQIDDMKSAKVQQKPRKHRCVADALGLEHLSDGPAKEPQKSRKNRK